MRSYMRKDSNPRAPTANRATPVWPEVHNIALGRGLGKQSFVLQGFGVHSNNKQLQIL